jgi:ABC-type Mn2+/Zn2+ transport system ATPase subunit
MFGYVPQSIQLDPVYLLTGFEVALMGAYGRIRPGHFVPPTERAFTRECLGAAGAEEFAVKRFAELSGGQKQRVLIARALTTRPDVLVLDEPTAGVDQAATQAVLEFLEQIRKEKKITILLCGGAPSRRASHLASRREGAPRYHGRTAHPGENGGNF